MKLSDNQIPFLIIPFFAITISSCSESAESIQKTKEETIVNVEEMIKEVPQPEKLKTPADFLPEGYVVFEEIHGDLNNDKTDDCVLIIKGTNKKNIVKDEYRGVLDKNRRGIIVLINNEGNYEVASKNYICFSSENEDGGVYYAPELNVQIAKNNLYIQYEHGRYGFWKYTFRLGSSDLELIGFDDSENRGPITMSKTSINYLSHKKQLLVNVDENADDDSQEEIFKETWSKIKAVTLIKLSEIKDFDELVIPE